MNFEHTYDELIDRYHSKQMTSEEKNEFENRLLSDKELFQENEMYIVARRSVIVAGRDELKSKMRSFEEAIERKDKEARFPLNYRFFALAASIAILIGAIWVLGIGTSNQDLYQANFEVYDSPTLVRGSGDISEWQKGIEAYNNKDFQKAFGHFEMSKDEVLYLRNFYQAQCLASMEPPQLQKALEKCAIVLESENLYVQQAKWYMGLFSMKLGKTEDAKNIFREIIQDDEYNSERAQKIMSSLE